MKRSPDKLSLSGRRLSTEQIWNGSRAQDSRSARFPALKAIAPGLEVFVTTRERRHEPRSVRFAEPRRNARRPSRATSAQTGSSCSTRSASRRAALARTGQIHGAEIAVVTRGGHYPGFDGFATERRGLALAISTADCYSVVIYSPPERALAALHVGRRGAEGGIIGRAVDLCATRFRIDPTLRDRDRRTGHLRAMLHRVAGGRAAFPEGGQTIRAGRLAPRPRRVHRARRSPRTASAKRTSSRRGSAPPAIPSLFFSHRRDGGVTGRHWTLAVVRPDPGKSPERCV